MLRDDEAELAAAVAELRAALFDAVDILLCALAGRIDWKGPL